MSLSGCAKHHMVTNSFFNHIHQKDKVRKRVCIGTFDHKVNSMSLSRLALRFNQQTKMQKHGTQRTYVSVFRTGLQNGASVLRSTNNNYNIITVFFKWLIVITDNITFFYFKKYFIT